jgi:serine/threonine-protein kinase
MQRAYDQLVGEVLGERYRLARLMGRGGMGAVYEAVDQGSSRRVAIKVLHPFLSEDGLPLARLRREAQAAASLGHPNVVEVIAFHSSPTELAYIVMEHLEGRSLLELLKSEKTLPPQRVVPLVRHVLSALGAAHAAGIVHRDIKPGNVMVVAPEAGREVAKVLDFGIAKMMEGAGYTRLTRTGLILGTPAYMAPEQVSGDPIDGRADIYAVGALTFRCLTGRLPYKAEDVVDLLREVLEIGPTRLLEADPTSDPRLAAIVDLAMQRRPEDRFQTALAMETALEAWDTGECVGLGVPPTVRQKPGLEATGPDAGTLPFGPEGAGRERAEALPQESDARASALSRPDEAPRAPSREPARRSATPVRTIPVVTPPPPAPVRTRRRSGRAVLIALVVGLLLSIAAAAVVLALWHPGVGQPKSPAAPGVGEAVAVSPAKPDEVATPR